MRRVRDAFRDNKTLNDAQVIDKAIAEGCRNLEMIQRQVRELFYEQAVLMLFLQHRFTSSFNVIAGSDRKHVQSSEVGH